MRNLSLTFLLLFGICGANAQKNHKTFLKADLSATDSAHATTYITCTQMSDTAWVVKQYGMNDTIKQIGTYKDQKLSIPHGKFVYYEKLHLVIKGFSKRFIDTLNHVRATGYYKDGVKDGVWTDYFSNGQIEYTNTYRNNILFGLHESYFYDTNTVLVKGNYNNGLRVGEWYILDPHGNIRNEEIYMNNTLLTRLTPKYGGPTPPNAFCNYMSENLKSSIVNLQGKVIIGFEITKKGKVINAQISKGLNNDFDRRVLNVLENSPIWSPAYNKTSKQSIDDGAGLTIEVKDGKLLIDYVDIENQKPRPLN